MFKRIRAKLSKVLKVIIFGNTCASREGFLNDMRKIGVRIGNNVHIVDPMNTLIDTTRPYLVEIGNDVTITDHVTILTHDFSISVIGRMYPGEIYPSCGKVKIGNNCFIGSHSTILGGGKDRR